MSWVQSPLLCEIIIICKSSRMIFPGSLINVQVSNTSPGFHHQYRPHVSIKDITYRLDQHQAKLCLRCGFSPATAHTDGTPMQPSGQRHSPGHIQEIKKNEHAITHVLTYPWKYIIIYAMLQRLHN